MDKLMLDDFTKYKFLSGIKFSPEGRNCGFIVHKMDKEENKYLSNIYILNESNNLIKLTSLDEERSLYWKDETTLLFPSIRNKKDRERKDKGEPLTIYYEININGGEADKVMEIPLNVSKLEIIDEDTLLLTGEFDERLAHFQDLPDEKQEKVLKDLKETKDYEIIDEIPFWSNGVGFTNKKRNKLYIYKINDKSLKPITDDFTNVDNFVVNKDKSQVLVITSSFIDKMNINSELNTYTFAEDKFEKISPLKHFNYNYADFIGDKIIFLGNNHSSFGLNQNPNFYIFDPLTNEVANIAKHFNFSIWNSVGSDCRFGGSQGIKVDGDNLYFTTTEGHASYLNKIDINGNMERLTSSIGSIDGFDVIGDKTYFIGLRGLKLQELYSLDSEKQLTNFNSWIIEEKTLSLPEKLTLINEDKIEIDGWVLKPVDYKKGNSYPAILNIHGGPKTVFGEVYFHEMQYWANQGYFVLFCNPRGSDGKGNEFADIRGKYGTIDYDDIMGFTDMVLINYPDIDKDRIGVTGGSYGGFMTNWIIGHTNRFKAAASQRSISNWVSFFGTTDIGYYFSDDQNLATPWSDIEKLWFHSPMKYADKVTTPTLFIHSEEDYRCWLPEGLQMFTALKYHGVESRLCMFKGENHELSRSGKPKNRIKRLEEITLWFDKYLK